MTDASTQYDSAWNRLNEELSAKESADGLRQAVYALEQHQRDTGFIKDDLFGVERHIFHHPDDPSLYFRIQFNSKRMMRFNGAGVTTPPEGTTIANDGCFLCRDNIRWQQEGAELGYALEANGNDYIAWMNPFPLLPNHVVVAASDHIPQDWTYNRPDDGLSVKRLIADLVTLAVRLPGHIGYYNGVNAGASIASHLHFQFTKRPKGLPFFPLEARLATVYPAADKPAIYQDYPVPVVKWSGEGTDVTASAINWIKDWAGQNAERLYRLTANVIVSADEDGVVTLYFVPRDRGKDRGEGMSGLVGGLEVLGELVMSSADERRMIDQGKIDYFTLEAMLRGVRTPLCIDLP